MKISRQDGQGRRLPSPVRSHSGFALVVALSLMAFILILMMSIMMLARVESVNSATQADLTQARQNAIFGLQVALGQLQEEMGPDKRISATATLLDESPATEDIDGVGQPYWTGAWDSLQWDRASEMTAAVPSGASSSDGKPSSFRRWLVSGLNDENMSPADQLNLAKQFTADSEGAILLVGEGTLGSAQAAARQSVYVPRAEIDDDSFLQNGFAYWVGDEGVKANFGTPAEATPNSNWEKIQATANPDRANLQALEGWGAFSDTAYAVDNVFDYAAIESLAEEDLDSSSAFDGKFHAVTPYSWGLLTNVRDGGLRKDLSLLFAENTLPTDYREEPMFEVDPAYGPEWDYVKRYYDRYKMLSLEDGVPTLDIGDVRPEVMDNLDPKPGDAPMPVIVRFQYIFSLYQGYNTLDGKSYSSRSVADPGANPVSSFNSENDDKIVLLMVTPVIYYWNPYNVTISMDHDESAKKVLSIKLDFPPIQFSFDDGTTYRSLDDSFWRDGEELISLHSSNYHVAPIVIPPGQIRIDTLQKNQLPINAEYRHLMYVSTGNKEKLFSRTAASEYGRARNLDPGFDESTPGIFTPALLGVTTGDMYAPQAKLRATGSIKPRLRFDPNDSDMSFRVFSGGEGGAPRQAAGMIQMETNTGTSSTILPTEFVAKESINLNSLPDIVDSAMSYSGINPVFILNFDLRAFDELEGLGKAGLFTDPANAYFFSVDTEDKTLATAPFRISFEEVSANGAYMTYDEETGSAAIRVTNPATGNVQIIDENIADELPVAPLLSIAQLENAPLGRDYRHLIYQKTGDDAHSPLTYLSNSDPEKRNMAPVFNRAVGNSFSHPMIAEDSVWDGAYAVDRSYFLNDVLFDGYFFSGLADDDGPYATGEEEAVDHLEAFLNGTEALPNIAYRLNMPEGMTLADAKKELLEDNPDEAFDRLAAFLVAQGMFNVNSTSVDAWAAMLSTLKEQAVLATDSEAGELNEEDNDDLTPVLPNMLPAGPSAESQGSALAARDALWSGFRALDDGQIRDLAGELVQQVKARGPFLSVSQFVNREISSRDAYNKTGALQAAIDAAGLNTTSDEGAMNSALSERFASNEMDTAAIDGAGFASPQSLYGDRNEGLPGYLTQADLLKPIAPVLSARSDTFIIRAYGDVKDGDRVVARAWCEAVVQRNPGYVGDAIKPWETPTDGSVADNFGRRFRIVSFRWLNQDDV